MLRATLLTISLLALTASAAADSSDARQWLQRMHDAMRALNYEGQIIFQQGGTVEPMRLRHQGIGDGGFERLSTLSGEAREIIHDPSGYTCFQAQGSAPRLERASTDTHLLPYEIFQALERLGSIYRLSLLAPERMAGHEAQVVAIEPNDAYRYGYRLWIDRDTALMLKFEVLDAQQQVLEQVMFTEIAVVDRFDREALLTEACRHLFAGETDSAEATTAPVVAAAWRCNALPAGFTLRESSHRTAPSEVVHLLYSDGLATVSIFIERAEAARLPDGHHPMGGPVNAFSRYHAPYQLVAVGEVPQATVEMMVDAVVADTGAQGD